MFKRREITDLLYITFQSTDFLRSMPVICIFFGQELLLFTQTYFHKYASLPESQCNRIFNQSNVQLWSRVCRAVLWLVERLVECQDFRCFLLDWSTKVHLCAKMKFSAIIQYVSCQNGQSKLGRNCHSSYYY